MTQNSGVSGRSWVSGGLIWLVNLPRQFKQCVMLLHDAVMLMLVSLVAWQAVLSQSLSTAETPSLLLALCAVVISLISIPFLAFFGLYRAVVRYMGDIAVIAVAKSALVSTAMFVLISSAARLPQHWSVVLIYLMLTLVILGGSRFLVRQLVNRGAAYLKPKVIIYGAGALGTQILKALNTGRDYQPVALVDDDTRLQGKVIDGFVVRSGEDLPHLIFKHGVSQLLLAIAQLSDDRKATIMRQVESYSIKVQAIPKLTDLIAGRAAIDEVRDKKIEQLWNRQTVPERERTLADKFSGCGVMVLGAGSLVGEALSKWLLTWHDELLVFVERSESSLLCLKAECTELLEQQGQKEKLHQVRFIKLNYHEPASVLGMLKSFPMHHLIYCAADEQVIMNEENVINVVQNNVMALDVVLRQVRESSVRKFTLLSTDKAIRPTSVVGATRRIQELLVLREAELNGAFGYRADSANNTALGIVRIGNILEAPHSVLTQFRQQLKAGGPIIVTHPEAQRYFIGLEEAVHLILQSVSMMRNGQLFVLDVGEPIKIAELAKSVASFMGYSIRNLDHPQGDVDIHYTGLRPGEKLFEEPLLADNAEGTEHPQILRADERVESIAALDRLVVELTAACNAMDVADVIDLLEQGNLGYRCKSEWVDQIWVQEEQERERKKGRLHSVYNRLRETDPVV